jgi:hypothetical protein
MKIGWTTWMYKKKVRRWDAVLRPITNFLTEKPFAATAHLVAFSEA